MGGSMTRARLGRVALGLVSIAIVVVTYRAALGLGFTDWDDDRFIVANPLFAAGGWTYVRAALTQIQFEAYQPLHLLSYLPDRLLWPDDPTGFHALNLVLFAANLVLLVRLVARHAEAGAAIAAVALFALHPLCVEPVVWITARKDLLMVLFFVAALGFEDRDGTRPSLAGLLCFVAALLTKTASV